MSKLLAIVNGASAGGKTAGRWPAVEAALAAAGVEVEVAFTEAPGHAGEIAAEAAAAGRSAIAACGGDGTLNEVVNGLIDETGAPRGAGIKLGVLPSGTGGDFRKTLGLSAEASEAAAVIARGNTRRIDAGIVEYADGTVPSRFVNIASCGVGYEVDSRINALKVKPGKFAYAMVSLRATIPYKPVATTVRVDGEEISGSYAWIAFANGQYFGGGMHAAPDADPSDGQLDVVLCELSGLRAVFESRHLYAGTHVSRAGTTVLRGNQIEVVPDPERQMGFDVDGEAMGFAPATIRALPGVLDVFC